jgi:hypothetical protein
MFIYSFPSISRDDRDSRKIKGLKGLEGRFKGFLLNKKVGREAPAEHADSSSRDSRV